MAREFVECYEIKDGKWINPTYHPIRTNEWVSVERYGFPNVYEAERVEPDEFVPSDGKLRFFLASWRKKKDHDEGGIDFMESFESWPETHNWYLPNVDECNKDIEITHWMLVEIPKLPCDLPSTSASPTRP